MYNESLQPHVGSLFEGESPEAAPPLELALADGSRGPGDAWPLALASRWAIAQEEAPTLPFQPLPSQTQSYPGELAGARPGGRATVARAPVDRPQASGDGAADTSAEGEPQEEQPLRAGSARAGGPDLDALARDVYSILRRRLAVERERAGAFGTGR